MYKCNILMYVICATEQNQAFFHADLKTYCEGSTLFKIDHQSCCEVMLNGYFYNR